MIWCQRYNIFSMTHTGRLKQAHEPSSGLLWSTHHFSWMLPHRGVYPLPGSVHLAPAEAWEGGVKSVPVSLVKEPMTYNMCFTHIVSFGLVRRGLWPSPQLPAPSLSLALQQSLPRFSMEFHLQEVREVEVLV